MMTRSSEASAGLLLRGILWPFRFPFCSGFLLASGVVFALQLAGRSVHLLDFSALAAVVIVVLGVPHGAFDVALARNRWNIGSSIRMIGFLTTYIALAGTVFVIWALLPALALPCFLLISGYHFAGDWDERLGRLSRFIVGTAIITSPAVFYSAEVTEIFSWIVPASVADTMPVLMRWLAIPSLLGTIVVVVPLVRSHAMTALELSAVTVLALFTEPLCFFVIYFCGLHSIRHMEFAHRELQPRSTLAFFSLSLPYAPLAVAGTLLGGWWIVHQGTGATLLGAVFISLAALTAPHMLLVDIKKLRVVRGPAE